LGEQSRAVQCAAREEEDEEQRFLICDMALISLAAVGVVGAGVGLYSIRPRDPVFEVQSITLSGFNVRFTTESALPMAVVDVSLTLFIKVINPNVTPIQFSSTVMDIYYKGTLLGQAQVDSGSQEAKSEQVMEVPAKLDGLKMTNHLKDLFADVTKREMTLNSVVTISGCAVVWKWKHNFEVHVNSDIKVDPVFLQILDQENRVELDLVPEI
jgi:LEA14-like dessication related protein